MSWKLLERFLHSDIFSRDPSTCVAYLSRYANHIGIQHILCKQLRRFPHAELEFFLPQLCHLIVSVETESVALEEFIIDLCKESASGALITFWLFQSATYDLRNDPHSPFFRTCRRLLNRVQHIVYGATEPERPKKINDNVKPTSILASLVLGSVAVTQLPTLLGPVAVSQALRPRPAEDTISEPLTVQTKLERSATTGSAKRSRRSTHGRINSKDSAKGVAGAESASRPTSKSGSRRPTITSSGTTKSHSRQSSLAKFAHASNNSVASLPGAVLPRHTNDAQSFPFPHMRAHLDDRRRHSYQPGENSLSVELSTAEKRNILRANYFRSETAFLQALEGISMRLVALPKPARLSALRAELALIARDLPAEVDLPVIEPATLERGVPSHSKHHRIVRLNPAEATSLNSAERVPYLLIVEVLREDFDFDPDTDANIRLLSTIINQKPSKRRPFDITSAHASPIEAEAPLGNIDSVFEPALGDLSSPDLLMDMKNGALARSKTPIGSSSYGSKTPPRLSSGTNTVSSYSLLSTPRTSEMPVSRSDSPTQRSGLVSQGRDQPDFSALATHMRTAAQMLAQLDISSSKRPKAEVEVIKAKIIANMRTLEEQSFNTDEDAEPDATFDAIMASAVDQQRSSLDTLQADGKMSINDARPDPAALPTHDAAAGIARTENDQKTGGIAPRKTGDREDPSYALFGEDWLSKKERIRKTSPYGFMRNWDLLSVIVKTGSDLRQELFACQMIRIFSKIWSDAKVPVWVRNMRILVTGENSGLIETITNGVSLHSLKRSLTLASIASGNNPRRRFATLKDHFNKAFGPDDSEAYVNARDAFSRSLAAYSIISYILQLKDRHNGNLLIDNLGHIIHIDFGFMLSNSPGQMGFEAAPFKLTAEYVDVLGGPNSAGWQHFKGLCKQAFTAVRKSAEAIVTVVELMSKESKMDCFRGAGGQGTLNMLRQRFALQMSEKEAEAYVEDLIGKSLGSYYTRLYDVFQYRTQGIY